MLDAVIELESNENRLNNLPLIFAEMFKDEINANDEHKLYNGVKRVIKKYSDDSKATSAINEFFRVITGGTSLDQILLIAKDEAVDPTPAVKLSIDRDSELADEQ